MKDAVLNRLFLRWRERGDGRALAAVFDLTAKELLAVAAHLARDVAEAEDLVQIVFLRAMERAAAFDRQHGLRPWLHGILWHEALAAQRRAARQLDPAGLERAPLADPVELAAERELPAAVRAALDALPRRYREVVEPLLLEQKPAHEIAAELGRSSGTVRMQIHRGLERLRRALPRGLAMPGLALLPTRGLGELRRVVLREAGVSASAGALSTGMLTVQTALTSVPALVLAPLVVGGAVLGAAFPELLPFHTPSIEPASQVARAGAPRENDAMKTSKLLALPAALVLSAAPAQEPPGREPATVETVAERVARLDGLVGELLTIAQQEDDDGKAAWIGLRKARDRIDGEQRRRSAAAQQVVNVDWTLTKGWTDAVSQIADPARREQALREIAAALASGSSERQLAACRALARLAQVKYDKQPFREPVLAIAQSSSGPLKAAALYALYNTVHRPEDLSLALVLADEPSPAVAGSGVHLLSLFSGGDLTGEAGAAVERIFERLDRRSFRDALSGLWGARVSPGIEARILELSRSSNGEEAHDAIYFGLSTFESKSRVVVERLAEALFDGNPNDSERALWGLGHGVPAEQAGLVAKAMRDLFEARSAPDVQAEALRLVGMYGTAEYAPWLQRIEANAELPDGVRAAATAALAAVRER